MCPEQRSSNPSGKRATFPRRMRLLRHADFERVYKTGRRHFSASLTAFYAPRADETKSGKQENGAANAKVPVAPDFRESGLRVGFTVSRALGGAVVRNRMKRRLREAVRLSHLPEANMQEVNMDVVINPKKSLLTLDFEVVLNEVRRAFVVIERNSTGYREPSTELRKTKAGSRNTEG